MTSKSKRDFPRKGRTKKSQSNMSELFRFSRQSAVPPLRTLKRHRCQKYATRLVVSHLCLIYCSLICPCDTYSVLYHVLLIFLIFFSTNSQLFQENFKTNQVFHIILPQPKLSNYATPTYFDLP